VKYLETEYLKNKAAYVDFDDFEGIVRNSLTFKWMYLGET
jgi:hypothetical protein